MSVEAPIFFARGIKMSQAMPSHTENSYESERERLALAAWKTAKARFNASNRIKKRQRFYVFAITVFTVTQIVLSVFLISLTGAQSLAIKVATTLSIGISVFVALISNSEPMTKDALDSYLLHKCGMSLMSLNKKIKNEINIDKNRLDAFSDEYDRIICDCNLNHDDIDYDLVRIENNEIPKKDHWKIYALNIFQTYGIHFLYLISVFGMGFLMFYLTNYFFPPTLS